MITENEMRKWHRTMCHVTPWLYISGDLHPDSARAQAQLAEWVGRGVTDIVDVRGEWSDAAFVAEHAPEVGYYYFGTHDDGSLQLDSWFDQGIKAMHEARRRKDATLMVHCHMGINRGPSMAFAMLLEEGYSCVEALTDIRDSRPIAAIAYAEDALRAHHRRHGTSASLYLAERAAMREWFSDNEIDVRTVIRAIRTAS